MIGKSSQAESLTITPESWDAFVTQHPKSTILQASRWGRFKSSFGWSWDVVPVRRHNDLWGGALLLYKSLPLNLGCVAYVPRGPVTDWEDETQLAAVLDTLEQAVRQRRAWALWVEPPLFDQPEARARLRALGLTPTSRVIQPPRTILVDIAPSEDEILANMKSKTRYNIRLSARKGVTVREGSTADVSTFYALMRQTGNRDDFGIHSETYYRQALELFQPSGHAALLLAEFEGETLAGLMVFAYGQTSWYFYGASSSRHRNLMPTYAVQWAAICWAKAQGCTTYDLWGIPDADEAQLEDQFTERSDGLWGVYRFKRGFGGQVVRYVGLWEKALNPIYPVAIKLWSAKHDL